MRKSCTKIDLFGIYESNGYHDNPSCDSEDTCFFNSLVRYYLICMQMNINENNTLNKISNWSPFMLLISDQALITLN